MPLTAVNAADKVDIRMGTAGAAAEEPTTVIDNFKSACKKWGDDVALTNSDFSQTWTWNEYYAQCERFAKALIKVGHQPHQGVNVIGFNSAEWLFANTGAIFAQGITAGIYTSNGPEACKYVTEHSDASVVVCEGEKQLAKYVEIQGGLPLLKALVVYGVDAVPAQFAGNAVPIYTFEAFQKLGEDGSVNDAELQARMEAQEPGHCCTLIYTSGTTGPPKAVMISHDNITWTARRDFVEMTNADRGISYLPLSHIAAQMLDIHMPMTWGAKLYFARPDALKGSLGTTLKAVKPTVFFGVPRVWEKIYEKMQIVASQTKGLKKKIAAWAKGKGTAYCAELQHGASGAAPSCFGCANSIVLSKVRAALGLQECRVCFTGAAPISIDILNYFASLYIPIYELFGQSECTGPATVNTPGFWKIGTTGQCFDGEEMQIREGDGEIVYRGRHVFMGYMKNKEATDKTVDAEGWLHSGDVGKIDDAGFLSITGRIKELIITAGGENIPPVLIEDELKRAMPAVANAMVVGDRRKYLITLLTLRVKVDVATGVPSQDLDHLSLRVAGEIGSDAKTVEQAASCPKFAKYFDDGLKAANAEACSRAQTVKKWALVPRDFSDPGGELTPTLKLKRPVVNKMYSEVIEALYA